MFSALGFELGLRLECGCRLTDFGQKDLALQTAQVLTTLAERLQSASAAETTGTKFPAIRIASCVGGEPLAEQLRALQSGVHIVVATAGRLLDLLEKRAAFNLVQLRCVVLDEADRLIDQRSEQDVQALMRLLQAPSPVPGVTNERFQRSATASSRLRHQNHRSNACLCPACHVRGCYFVGRRRRTATGVGHLPAGRMREADPEGDFDVPARLFAEDATAGARTELIARSCRGGF